MSTWQVLEQFHKRGGFQVCPVLREPGCLRVVPVRETGMGQILAAGREHDSDFLERARFRPLALGGEAVVGTAYDLFHRYVLFTSEGCLWLSHFRFPPHAPGGISIHC